MGGSAGSREPRGAGRHWEAVAELRGDPQCRRRAAADPIHSPRVHICTGTVPPHPHPHSLLTLARQPIRDTDSIPFPSFPFYSLGTQLCTPRSPGHGRPNPLPAAIAPQTRSSAPSTLPSPEHPPHSPGDKATYLGALIPGEGPHRGLSSSIHLGGRLSAGQGSGCSSACRCCLSPSLACSKETTDLISPWPF